MAGQIRLFEKVGGLLVEVSPDAADDAREGRRFSSVSIVIDVLWTADEEAARDAEEAAAAEDVQQRLRGIEMAQERQERARARLQARGISADDLKDAIG
jgi:aminopeptidase N